MFIFFLACLLFSHSTWAFMGTGPNPKMAKWIEKGEKAYESMQTCLDKKGNTRFHAIRCLNKTITSYPYNTTWHKMLGAIYLTTEQRLNAYLSFNYSVMELLRVQGYTGHELLMTNGAAEALKLYGARDPKGAVEMAKVMMFVAHQQQAYDNVKILYDTFSKYKETDTAMQQLASTWSSHLLATLQLKEALPFSPASTNPGSRVVSVLTNAVESFMDHHFEMRLYAPKFLGKSAVTACYTKAYGAHKKTRTLSEVVAIVSQCAGPIHGLVKQGAVQSPFGVLNKTLVSFLAEYGFVDLLKLVLQQPFGKDAVWQKSRHGQTAMHRAVLAGQVAVVKTLMAFDASLASEPDETGYTPRRLLCEHKYYHPDMIAALGMRGGTDCDDADDRIDDDAVPERGQGGWSPSDDTSDASCDFDVRDAAAMLPKDFIGFYIVPEKPVLLRRAVRLSALEKSFKKSSFLTSYGAQFIRREPFPLSESFGVRHTNTTTLEKFATAMGSTNDVVAEWVIKGHYLYNLTLPLHPSLFDTQVTQLRWDPFPQLFVLGGAGSGTNSRIHTTPAFNSLAFGVRDWALQPPPSAVASNVGPKEWAEKHVAELRPSLRCRQSPGDILVIPRHWSSSYVGAVPHLGIERSFDLA